jgi:hypothetical protein
MDSLARQERFEQYIIEVPAEQALSAEAIRSRVQDAGIALDDERSEPVRIDDLSVVVRGRATRAGAERAKRLGLRLYRDLPLAPGTTL